MKCGKVFHIPIKVIKKLKNVITAKYLSTTYPAIDYEL